MSCVFGCTLCNKCGKLDGMFGQGGNTSRVCPSCGAPAGDAESTCIACGQKLPPKLILPGQTK